MTESTDNEEGHAAVFGALIGVIFGRVCGVCGPCCFILNSTQEVVRPGPRGLRRGRSKGPIAPGSLPEQTAPLVTPNHVAQPGAPPQLQQQIQTVSAEPIILSPIQQWELLCRWFLRARYCSQFTGGNTHTPRIRATRGGGTAAGAE